MFHRNVAICLQVHTALQPEDHRQRLHCREDPTWACVGRSCLSVCAHFSAQEPLKGFHETLCGRYATVAYGACLCTAAGVRASVSPVCLTSLLLAQTDRYDD
jgi:hypothetical protein